MNTSTEKPIYKISLEDIAAISIFCKKYPTWWFKIGICHLTRDFDAAPEGHSPEIKYIESGLWTDDCFTCDHRGTLEQSILDVMAQIEEALKLADVRCPATPDMFDIGP